MIVLHSMLLRTRLGLFFVAGSLFVGLCIMPRAQAGTTKESTAMPASAADIPEFQQKDFVYEVIGHLYRWYLDEMDVAAATRSTNGTVWVRSLKPELDEGDQSCFAEILLPVIGVKAVLKMANYRIEEQGLDVQSDGYKVIRVTRVKWADERDDSWWPVKLDGAELRHYLFNRRGSVTFPNAELIERLRVAVRRQVLQHQQDKGRALPTGDRVIHLASLSPVANECWVFWEEGRLLLHFSSDLDLANPVIWEHEELSATLYDIDEQVVVSLQEVPGSNAYLTRDQVGRALYNCIVLGRTYTVSPPDQAP